MTADDEMMIVRDFLKSSKHANFYIRNKHSVDLNWFMIKKIMNPRQVTKDFKRQGCGKKSYKTYMTRFKQDILRDNNSTPSTFSSTDNFIGCASNRCLCICCT